MEKLYRMGEAAQLLDPKDMIIDDEPLQVFIQEETFTPAQPEPSASLSLILQVEYEIHYISWEDLYNMGNTTLDAVLPAGYQAQPATLEIDSAVQPGRRRRSHLAGNLYQTDL